MSNEEKMARPIRVGDIVDRISSMAGNKPDGWWLHVAHILASGYLRGVSPAGPDGICYGGHLRHRAVAAVDGFVVSDGSPILVEEPARASGVISEESLGNKRISAEALFAASAARSQAGVDAQSHQYGITKRFGFSGVTQADVQRWMTNAQAAMGITRLNPTGVVVDGCDLGPNEAIAYLKRRLEAAEHRANTVADEAGDLRHELSRVHAELGRVTMALDAARRGKR